MMINIGYVFRRVRGETQLKYKRLKKTLNRLKSKKYPARPKTIEESGIMFSTNPTISTDYGQTQDKHSNFYVDTIVEKDYAFQIFASFAVINFIKTYIDPGKRFYAMDGTFKVIPRTFSQLLIITVEFQNNVSENSTFNGILF